MLIFAVLLSLGVAGLQEAGEGDVSPNCRGNTLEVAACYAENEDKAEAEQQVILARIDQALSALSSEHGVEPDAAKRALAEAQTHWSAFVAADCGAGEALFGDGNAFALDAMECEIAHIEGRNEQLRQFEIRYLAE